MNWMIRFACCGLALAFCSMVLAAPPGQIEIVGKLPKSAAPADIDYQTYIDANQLLMFVTNQGSFAYDNGAMFGKADGLYYPKGTNLTAVYAAGLWLGARVGLDLRVSLAEYSHTYWPGPMVYGTFDPNAAVEPALHVYKLYKSLASSGFYDSPTPSDPDSLGAWNNYHQWPASMGAPVDLRGKPLFFGDQTLWCVYNDANPAMHTNSSGSAQGLGVEVQQTVFAFDRVDDLGNCVLIHYIIINKSNTFLNDMYLSFWADPDLGNPWDDLIGCDTSLDLEYCYNATNDDAQYGENPPAVGFRLLQGPAVPVPGDSARRFGSRRYGFRNLPMTAFIKFINGTDPTSSEETYRYMQGLNKDGNTLFDPITRMPTKYMLSGDPVGGTGWIDADPADRRFLLSSGPFDMAPGDTQEVIMAVIVGQGIDRLSSVKKLNEAAALLPKILTPDFKICTCLKTGDLNNNGIVFEIADLIFGINYALKGGAAPPSDQDCPLINRADFNCDGRINMADIVRMAYLIFGRSTVGPCDPCHR